MTRSAASTTRPARSLPARVPTPGCTRSRSSPSATKPPPGRSSSNHAAHTAPPHATVLHPPPPPTHPAPPGAARREARQRQAAAAKSEEGSEKSDAQQLGGDLANSPETPTSLPMTARRRIPPGPSITTLAHH